MPAPDVAGKRLWEKALNHFFLHLLHFSSTPGCQSFFFHQQNQTLLAGIQKKTPFVLQKLGLTRDFQGEMRGMKRGTLWFSWLHDQQLSTPLKKVAWEVSESSTGFLFGRNTPRGWLWGMLFFIRVDCVVDCRRGFFKQVHPDGLLYTRKKIIDKCIYGCFRQKGGYPKMDGL